MCRLHELQPRRGPWELRQPSWVGRGGAARLVFGPRRVEAVVSSAYEEANSRKTEARVHVFDVVEPEAVRLGDRWDVREEVRL